MKVDPRAVFVEFPREHGLLHDLGEDRFPSRLWYWRHQPIELPEAATHFGLVYDGLAELRCPAGRFELRAGMYFAVPGAAELHGAGEGVVMSRLDFAGLFQVGGPVESRGRLRYIDGCTDSLLIPPVMLGDPCLNLLHIPRHTEQSQHTHPSLRLGMILRGTGHCVTPTARVPLAPGQVFLIQAGGRHSFHTGEDELLVLAWHPDSDFGPTHADHPMRNRTILPGAGPAGSGR